MPCCVTSSLIAMALALSSAGQPLVTAIREDALGPARMVGAAGWEKARPLVLAGFDGAPAQRAEVRVLWNKDWLFFAFDCSDNSVISPGDRDGLDHFRLGDTAEVFIAPRGAKSYAEFHATPAGCKTLYFFGDYRSASPAPAAAARVRVESERDGRGWRSFIAVPRDLFAGDGGESGYDVFFARYDYDAPGASPLLSSFPAQHGRKADFHRRADYAVLQLKP